MESNYKAELNPNGQGKCEIIPVPSPDSRVGYFVKHFSDQISSHGLLDLKIELYGAPDIYTLPRIVGEAIGEEYGKLLDERGRGGVAGCVWPFQGSVGIATIDALEKNKYNLLTDIRPKLLIDTHPRHRYIQEIIEKFSSGFVEMANVYLSILALAITSPIYRLYGLQKDNGFPLPDMYSFHHLAEASIGKAVGRTMDDLINTSLKLVEGELPRRSYQTRKTGETAILSDLTLDGQGKYDVKIDTSVDPSKIIPSVNRSVELFAKYSKFNLTLDATKLKDEPHHVSEDIGIVLGASINDAIGDKKGIRRLSWCMAENEELAGMASVDFSGRKGHSIILDNRLYKNLELIELTEHFIEALSSNSVTDVFGFIVRKDHPLYKTLALTIGEGMYSRLNERYGLKEYPEGYKENPSYLLFALLGEAYGNASKIDPRRAGITPSTKGVL